MKNYYPLFLLATLLLAAPEVRSQAPVLMLQGMTTEVDACVNTHGTICDDGGSTGNYTNSFNGTVVITAPAGVTITLSGSYHIETYYDKLSIYDGYGSTGTCLVSEASGIGSINVTSSTGYLSIIFITDGSVTYEGFELSYSVGGTSATCSGRPTSLTTSNITQTSVLLSWTAADTTGGFWLQVGSDTHVVHGLSYQVTGLSMGTVYEAVLTCMADSLNRCCAKFHKFRTTCSVITPADLPYTYGFEDATSIGASASIDACYLRLGSLTGYPYPTTSTAHGGNYCMFFENTNSTHYCMLVLPEYSGRMSELQVEFWQSNAYTGHSGKVEVGVMTDPLDPSTFVRVRSVWNDSTGYVRQSVPLSEYAGSGRFVALRVARSEQYIYVDDIVLRLQQDCPDVTGLSCQAVSGNTIVLEWDTELSGLGYPISYEIEAIPVGGGATVTATASHSPGFVSGLSSETSYLLRVRALCNNAAYGDWDSLLCATMCTGGGLSSMSGNVGASVNNVPVNTWWGNTLCQSIYTAADLRGMGMTAGNIVSISYAWTANTNYAKHLTIYMATTSQSSFSSNTPVTTGHTQVYSGDHPVGTSGRVKYNLSSPFYWNGISNLVVTTFMNQPSGESHVSSGFYGLSSPTSGYMTAYAYRDNSAYTLSDLTSAGYMSIEQSRPDIELEFCNPTAVCLPPLVVVDSVGMNTIHVSWAPGNNEMAWNVEYRQSGVTTWTMLASNYTATEYLLTNLTKNTMYEIRVSAICGGSTYPRSVIAQTRCNSSYFRYDDLHASNVECYYGSFSNPDQYEGVVDFGFRDGLSRHTVHTDPTETDYNTGGQLFTIPEGSCSSVRLGNWNTGAEAESIIYTHTVDTNDADLLLLKYAAVLEDPNHTSSEQPRFTFRIFDNENNTISPCYNADFIANASLGWNTYYSTLWKDWTTVGVDLSAMHGQTINIKLTTYDCSQSGHFGYAYFVLDLDHKALRSNSCSTVENTFYAPLGFSYRWYEEGFDEQVLSTTDSLQVNKSGTFHCRLSFVGAPDDDEHSDCAFTMTAVSGIRYPYARFTPHQLDTSTCRLTWMRMINQSIITRDSAHLDSIANGCESYFWSFDDGSTSTEINPRHGFRPGYHTVTLYAMLADGACADSVSQTFLVVSPCMVRDTVYRTICEGDSLTMFDTVMTTAGVYDIDSTTAGDSVLLRTLYLTVLQNTYDTVAHSSCTSYQWALSGQSYSQGGLYNYTLANAAGCDSVVTLDLIVVPPYETNLYDTICEGGTVVCFGNTYSTEGVYSDTLQTVVAPHCDSVVLLNLTVNDNTVSDTFATACDRYEWYGSIYTGSVTDSLYNHYLNQHHCDSTVVLHLALLHSSQADYYDTCHEDLLPRHYLGITAYGDTTNAYDTIANSVGCDSVVRYHLHVLYRSSAIFDTIVCQSALPLQWYHRTFTASGTQYDTLVNHMGTDSILTLNVQVVPTVYEDVYQTICSNLSYYFEGASYSVAGNYQHQFVTSEGCDSIRTLHLTVLNITHGDTVARECDSFSWHGTTWTASDTIRVEAYTTNVVGCDSSVTLHLTIKPSYSISVYDTICGNQTLMFEGSMYGVQGTYPVVLHTVGLPGCDSIRTLYLTVRDTSLGDTSAVVCDQYVWYGRTYMSSGVYVMAGHYSNMEGCDSAVRLSLTVNYPSQTVFADTCVENDLPRIYNGLVIAGDTSGVVVTLTDRNGCDSIVTYSLHVWRNKVTTMEDTICDDALAAYVWNGVHSRLSPVADPYLGEKPVMNDTLTVNLATSHGADSVVTMILHVRPTYHITMYDTICANTGYNFGGQTLDQSGLYGHTFATQWQCDSVVTLDLTVNPVYHFDFYDTIYPNETVWFEGGEYGMPGNYDVRYATVWGCDSVLELHLTGRNIQYKEIVDSMCEGDTYYFLGNPITEAGVYTDTLFTGDFLTGDTIVRLTLVVVPYPEVSVDRTFVCEDPAHYVLKAHADVSYIEWQGPGVVEGREHDSVIAVLNPVDTTLYQLLADYREERMCPQSLDVVLTPIALVRPTISLRPSALTLEERHLSAVNVGSGVAVSYLWTVYYNDVVSLTDTSRRLQLDVPMYVDSAMIVLDVSNEMCSASDTAHVEVLKADILFPNVFTPELGENNRFRAYTAEVGGFELWIYDRGGDLVFHSTDVDEGWDGTHEGRPCRQGAYVYKCRYRDGVTPGGWQVVVGSVTLLR